jgi:hypothetical protein
MLAMRPAEGLAADNEVLATAQFLDRVTPGLHQRRPGIRRATFAGFAPPTHVGKLEPGDTDAGLGNP